MVRIILAIVLTVSGIPYAGATDMPTATGPLSLADLKACRNARPSAESMPVFSEEKPWKQQVVHSPCEHRPLDALIGSPRDLILSELGVPDYCPNPEPGPMEIPCDQAMTWHYAFTRYPREMYMVRGGGGGNLWLTFDAADKVASAHWIYDR